MIRIEKYYYELPNGSWITISLSRIGGGGSRGQHGEHTLESAQEPTIMRLSMVTHVGQIWYVYGLL